ncbi:phage tail protein [Jiella endophytica]|uniref:Phage tail protein n=1 Tax=Jiella endophytica TaxID=2558362 RepID=A0A4Y8RET1_9HYPH|nr:phage tail protein [Jiella endophytica]TFF20826.1 phage tail protein [Jiella endophytica]
MASVEFHHGSRVFQSGDEATVVRLRSTSVGGLVIPIATGDLPTGYAFDRPFLVAKPSDAAGLPDAVKEEIDSFYDQTINQIVVVMVDKGATAATTTANMVGDFATRTGIHALLKATSMGLPRPKLIAMAGYATSGAADGIASVAVTTEGANYSADTTITVSGTTGQGAEFEPIIGTGGAITGVVVTKPGWGYTGALTFQIVDPNGSGAGAVLAGTIGSVLNPVLAEAIGVADKLRAMIYTDGPDGTNQQAVQARLLIGSKRVAFCDPRVLKSIDGVPYPRALSTIYAGLQAKMDKEKGAVFAGSNVIISGIQGVNRPVEYGEEANYLNQNRVNTVINRGNIDGAGGFRAWGVWTCADDPIWQFIPVVRVTDLVNESIEEAFLQFVGRPQTLAQLDNMVMTGRNALRGLESEQFLLPGSDFWLLNGQSASDGVQGIVKFGMKFEVPAPIVDIRITAYRNFTVAYELLYSQVSGEVEVGATL